VGCSQEVLQLKGNAKKNGIGGGRGKGNRDCMEACLAAWLKYYNFHNIVVINPLVYHTTAGNPIECHRCFSVLNKGSVFVMLLTITASLVGISSVYQPAEVKTHVLQPALASPLPGVIETQLLQPPLPPPGLPPIDLPGLPPIQSPPGQQQSSGGSTIR
jgi:hypothetical protein